MSLDRQQTFDRIIKVVKPFVRDAAALERVDDTTQILQDLKVNSARLVDIVIAIEDEFDIAIDDSEADKVITIGNAVDLVVAQSAQAA